MAICLDFDWQTNEFMLHCRSTQLREHTMYSNKQTLQLFERWCADEFKIYSVDKVTENVIRKYFNNLQEREKYTFYVNDLSKKKNYFYYFNTISELQHTNIPRYPLFSKLFRRNPSAEERKSTPLHREMTQ